MQVEAKSEVESKTLLIPKSPNFKSVSLIKTLGDLISPARGKDRERKQTKEQHSGGNEKEKVAEEKEEKEKQPNRAINKNRRAYDVSHCADA